MKSDYELKSHIFQYDLDTGITTVLLSIGYRAQQFAMLEVKFVYIFGSQSNSIPNINALACSINCDPGDIGLLAVSNYNAQCTNPSDIPLSRVGDEQGIHVEKFAADEVED